jgi:hypothetical protein
VTNDEIDDTVIRPRVASAATGAAPAAAAPAPDDDDTIIRPERPAHVDAGSELGDTIIRGDRAGGVRPRADALGDTIIRPPGAGPVALPPIDSAVPGARPAAPSDASAAAPAPVRRVPSIRIGPDVLRLDQPLIIGRKPAPPRIVLGPAPRLVAVRSARGEVSSSHVRISAEGEAVLVEDLRSTNGTFVREPGRPPHRIPAGAGIVVLTGTVVDIGDGNEIEILSPHLRITARTADIPGIWPEALPPIPGT